MGVSPEQTIAFEIKENALKKVVQIGEAITPSLEHLEFVVEAFDKAAGQEIDEIIGDRLPMAMQGVEKAVETGQPTVHDLRVTHISKWMLQRGFNG